MRLISIIFLLTFITGCSMNKEQRKLQRKSKKVEKLYLKSKRIAIENGLTVKDTVEAIVIYIPKKAYIDTIIPEETDSLVMENEDIIVTYTKDEEGDVKLAAEIKPNPKEVKGPVVVERTSKPVFIEKETTLIQKIYLKVGAWAFWGMIILFLLLLIYLAYRIYRKVQAGGIL